MRKILLLLLFIFPLSAAISYAAESASLSVTGTITPATCDITLSSSVIDLGNIAAATLSNDYYTVSGNTISVNLLCDSATAVALQSSDNRPSSAMTSAEVLSEMALDAGVSDTGIFGLGLDSVNNKVGAMTLNLIGGTLNGTTDNNILISKDKSSWSAVVISYNTPYVVEKDALFALAEDATSVSPAVVSIASYSFKPLVNLKKANKYPAGETVAIDGSVTFSLVYL